MAFTKHDHGVNHASRTIEPHSPASQPRSIASRIHRFAFAVLLMAMAPLAAHAQWCELPDGDWDGDECLSQDNPKNYGGCSADSNGGAPSCGDPINIGIGNKYETEVDYRTNGPSPLVLSRSYNSLESGLGSMGIGWRSSYSRAIATYTGWYISNWWWVWGTYVSVTRDDGKALKFYPNGKGGWYADGDINAKLASTSTGGYVYTTGHDETETYNAAGRLISVTNRAGLTQTMSYDATGHLISVADASGRSLKFAYTGALLTSATAADGGVYQYAYDTRNNLVKVTYPDLSFRTFVYENVYYPHALTGVFDENGSRYATDTYDYYGRDVSNQLAAGVNKFSLNYAYLTYSYVPVTDALNVTRTSYFSIINNIPAETSHTQSCPTCAAAIASATRTMQYDTNANVTRRTDFNGNATCYAYDTARNLETVRVEGVPPNTACPGNVATATLTGVERRITTQWSTAYRLPAKVAEPLRITSYTYDAHGNMLTKSIQPTTDATGALAFGAASTSAARTRTYTYNTAGQILSVDGPRTDVADITRYTYDALGNLLSVTNALNQATTLGSYDATGRPGTITDANGLVTTSTYDVRGRITSRSVGGEVSAYTYDKAGQLVGVRLPSGMAYTYTYDAAHRLIQIADALNNKLVYTLDNAGNRTKEQLFDATGALAKTRSRVFDALSHLVQDIGAVNQTTAYTYDKQGNQLTVTDPLSRQTVSVYDALNRVSQVAAPDAGIVHYAYDGLGQLAQVADPRNLATQYARDGLGGLTQQKSPDTGTTNATYDAAGNMLTRTDARGQTTTYTYDVLNRVSTVSFSGGMAAAQTIGYQYDTGTNGIGYLTGMTDATGTVAYAYDQHGRLVTETAKRYGASYTTAYTYDAQGRLAAIGYPTGRVVSYTFDTVGRISGIAHTYSGQTKVLASNIAYQPMGGVKSFTYGDGLTAPVQTYTRQYDQDGRIASYTLNGKAMSIGYDPASQISFVADPANLANTANYTYDPMSRLKGFTLGTASQNFSYDVDGNRTSKTVGATLTSYTYGTGSNWLTAMQTGATALAVAHDANGATTADGTRQYAYDLRGRLIQTATAQGAVTYQINALGQRVRKQVPYAKTDTAYHYDTAGHLIGESPAGSTQFNREFVWLGDIPVAVIQ